MVAEAFFLEGSPPFDMWPGKPACADADPEIFFPDVGIVPVEARAICRACPVREECLDWGVTHVKQTPFGVWGGHTAKEREELARKRRNKGRPSRQMIGDEGAGTWGIRVQ